jgi:hypothetical protein
MRGAAAGLALAVLVAAPGAARALQQLVVVEEYIYDANAPRGRPDEFTDTTFHCRWSQGHVAVTFGSFAAGLQAGGYVRDGRGSAYAILARRRQEGAVHDTALEIETNQVLGQAVATVALRGLWPDRPEDEPFLLAPALGFELYYGSFSFASARLVRDPRPGTGSSFRLANRLGGERGHLEVVLAPRTDGVVNWSIGVRWKYVVVGWARERDFDFSRLDRRVVSLGFHIDLTP